MLQDIFARCYICVSMQCMPGSLHPCRSHCSFPFPQGLHLNVHTPNGYLRKTVEYMNNAIKSKETNHVWGTPANLTAHSHMNLSALISEVA